MSVTVATVDDLDWLVDLLHRRREPLVEQAPVFWRPAPDARERHHQYLEHLLTEAGARAYRTDAAAMIATRRGDGWLVDDMYVPTSEWASGDGRALWNGFVADCHGDEVRFVCPVYEADRAQFAAAAGLAVAESWWLIELTDSAGGAPGVAVELPGADAITVGSPAVYAPPGPMLFLPGPITAPEALSTAISAAPTHGCAGVVVAQPATATDLPNALQPAGFRRHCDFYEGTVEPIRELL